MGSLRSYFYFGGVGAVARVWGKDGGCVWCWGTENAEPG